MPRGKPFEPGNKLGRGRPPGSRNKTTSMARQLLDSKAELIVRKCIVMAMEGDPKAMQLCMDRAVPVRRDMPIKLGSLSTGTVTQLDDASEKLFAQVAAGKLTPSEANQVAHLIEGRRRVIETKDLYERVRKLEVQQ